MEGGEGAYAEGEVGQGEVAGGSDVEPGRWWS